MTSDALPCEICGRPVADYVPQYCCGSYECDCRGQPTNPCVCGEKCYEAIMSGIGTSYEERRIAAGIERWMPGPSSIASITAAIARIAEAARSHS